MQHFFRHQFNATAKVYADCLKDDFASVLSWVDREHPETAIDKENRELCRQLEKTLDDMMIKEKDSIDLAKIFSIETALIESMPDEVIMAKMWSIRDRFERVVPKTARDRYYAAIPNMADWEKAQFVRSQARSMLDIIHTNYLLNQGRERHITHLKMWICVLFIGIWAAFGVCLSVVNYKLNTYLPQMLAYGLVVLSGALGAIISTIRRLQGAITRDTMDNDAVYELMNLENGRFAIISSVFSGGVFAVLLYLLVMSQYMQELTPKTFGALIPTSSQHCSMCVDKVDAATAMTPAILNVGQGSKKNHDAGSGIWDCGDEAASFIEHYLVKPLMLDGIRSFFQLLILAFMAGFAERFVPDVLDRIAKKAQEAK